MQRCKVHIMREACESVQLAGRQAVSVSLSLGAVRRRRVPRSVPHPLGLKGWTHLLLSSSIVTDSRRVNPRSLQRRMRHLIHFLDWIRSALVGIAFSSPAPCSALYRERERERENIVHIKHESGDVQTRACIHCKTLSAQNACASARRQKSHTSLSRGTQTRRLHDEAAVLEGSLSRVHPAVRQQRQQLQDDLRCSPQGRRSLTVHNPQNRAGAGGCARCRRLCL